jgi:hypothetical protein
LSGARGGNRRWKRRLRWPSWLQWTLAGALFALGLASVWESATFKRAIAEHPVRVQAVVTSSYINGFGGDPTVEYSYSVDGRGYTGTGHAELGPANPEFLHAGNLVNIEYAAGAPSESCSCNAVSKQPWSVPDSVAFAVLLSCPLGFLVVRRRRRRQIA